MTEDELVEKVARALCRLTIEQNLRFETESRDQDFIQRCIESSWTYYTEEARAAIAAMPT